MIRMIIVDDEYLILDSLKTLVDWKSIGVEVAGSADNGAAALDLALKLRPDIILSDIAMPGFSGLELLETLRRHDMRTEVIFITAYGKFEYAKEAIRYGVFDYILKPIDEALLLSSVSRCADKIRSRRGEPDPERRLNELLLQCLLAGKAPDETGLELLGERGLEFPYAALVGIRHEKERSVSVHAGDFSAAWVSAPLRAAEDLTLFLLCFSELPAERPTTERPSVMRQWAAAGADIITVSECTGLAACFERAYAQVSFALIGAEIHWNKTAGQSRAPVFFADMRKSAAAFPGFESAVSALSRCVREGRVEAAGGLLYRFFLGFLETEILYDAGMVELYCIELLDHIIRENGDCINPAALDTSAAASGYMSIRKKIAARSGIREIFNAVCEMLRCLCDAETRTRSSLRLVRQTVRFIHEHYMENISLPAIAGQFLISPNYLSRIFSAEMGEPFSQYLREYRLNMAKKLLRETYVKVYEIAAQVGYADVVQFSKIFKRFTGMSPHQYRNQR